MADNIFVYNIEVPKDVINDNEPPKNIKNKPAQKRPAQKKTTKKVEKPPVDDVEEVLEKENTKEKEEKKEKKEETVKKKDEVKEEIKEELSVEEPKEEPKKIEKKEAPKKTTQKKTVQKKTLASTNKEPKKLAKETREEVKLKEPTRITEIELPKAQDKPQKNNNKNYSGIVSWLIPTHGDQMTEIIRKGLVIICIVVLIFSMGILFKSTRLEKKASSKNAGTYFVSKYVTSYDIYKDKEN